MKLKKSKYLDKRFWLDFLFPNRCAFCGKIINWDLCCCEKCAEKIPYVDEKLCEKCGKPECVCEREIHYDRCFSVAWYDERMKAAVVKFKSESPENFAGFFSERLAEMINKSELPQIDVITAVPMSKKSRAQRGYNQAFEIAKCMGGFLGIKASDNILVKKNTTFSQHRLSYIERTQKVKGVYGFSGKADVRDKTILLCDDIITTGSTLDECAKVLKENGAKYVICATAANTRLNIGKNN